MNKTNAIKVIKQKALSIRRIWTKIVFWFAYFFKIKYEIANNILLLAIIPFFAAVGNALNYILLCQRYAGTYRIPIEYLPETLPFLNSVISGMYVCLILAFLCISYICFYDWFFEKKERCPNFLKRYATNFMIWIMVSVVEVLNLALFISFFDFLSQSISLDSIDILLGYQVLLWPPVGWVIYNYKRAKKLSKITSIEVKYAARSERLLHIMLSCYAIFVYLYMFVIMFSVHTKDKQEDIFKTEALCVGGILLLIYFLRVISIILYKKPKPILPKEIALFIDVIGERYLILPVVIFMVVSFLSSASSMIENETYQYRITPDYQNAVIYSSPQLNILEAIEIDSTASHLTINTDHQTIIDFPIEYEIMEFDTVTILDSSSQE